MHTLSGLLAVPGLRTAVPELHTEPLRRMTAFLRLVVSCLSMAAAQTMLGLIWCFSLAGIPFSIHFFVMALRSLQPIAAELRRF